MDKTADLGSYYASIATLTPVKETGKRVASANNRLPQFSLSPELMLIFIGLIFGLFLLGLVAVIYKKLINTRRAIAVVGLLVAVLSVPFVLQTVSQKTSLDTRASPDEVPKNIEIRQINPSEILITWSTLKDVTGSVRYDKIPYNTQNAWIAIADSGKKTSSHKVILSNLLPKSSYGFEILSGKAWYDNSGIPLVFTLQ